jgi:hypothetical protein
MSRMPSQDSTVTRRNGLGNRAAYAAGKYRASGFVFRNLNSEAGEAYPRDCSIPF